MVYALTPIDRCQVFSIPQKSCMAGQLIPDASYRSLLSAGTSFAQSRACNNSDCSTGSYRDECDFCDSDLCKKFCLERRSNSQDLLAFVKDLARRPKRKKQKQESSETTSPPEQKVVTVIKEVPAQSAPQKDSTTTQNASSTPSTVNTPTPQTVPSTSNTNTNTNTNTNSRPCSENNFCSAPGTSKPYAACGGGEEEEKALCKSLLYLLSTAVKRKKTIPSKSLLSSILDNDEGLAKKPKQQESDDTGSEKQSGKGSKGKERKKQDSKPESKPEPITVTRYVVSTKKVEVPFTLYREFTTTITKEKPITNYRVTTFTENASTVTMYETVTIEDRDEKPKASKKRSTKKDKMPPKARIPRRKKAPVEESEDEDSTEESEEAKPKSSHKRKEPSQTKRNKASDNNIIIIEYPKSKEEMLSKCPFIGERIEEDEKLKEICKKFDKKENKNEKSASSQVTTRTIKAEDRPRASKEVVTVEKTVERVQTQIHTEVVSVSVPQYSAPISTIQTVMTVTQTVMVLKPEEEQGKGKANKSGKMKSEKVPSSVQDPEDEDEETGQDNKEECDSEEPSSFSPKGDGSEPYMFNRPKEKPTRMICEDKKNRKFFVKKVGTHLTCKPDKVCKDPVISRFLDKMNKNAKSTGKNLSMSNKHKSMSIKAAGTK